ncbi:Flagellar basal body rod protein FlgB [Pirellulimonas nuda]|uniref:Flagellar basal body rod protein FlgB n=1 Tax=Pirellulimonas nuda TaxID=2528009 RepID=A0A518D9R9_9BACT|nr:flagellar basal body rod protein FlgB [Pirellulimonas nuda]QDU88237.1 Flagellar basal body rod protein FlgB [Pirellulimonas nuda]
MLANLFQGSTVPVLEQVVNFAEARHGVLAGNIANLDTPGYKSRDLSPQLFQEKLKNAVESRRNRPDASEIGSPGLLAAPRTERADEFAAVSESLAGMLRHDGTDVSIENQVAEISKNQSMHNMAVSLLSQQFRLMRSAISERGV